MMFSYSFMQHAHAVETAARIQRIVATERMIRKLKLGQQKTKK